MEEAINVDFGGILVRNPGMSIGRIFIRFFELPSADNFFSHFLFDGYRAKMVDCHLALSCNHVVGRIKLHLIGLNWIVRMVVPTIQRQWTLPLLLQPSEEV
jgi:hypothetical protein